MDLLYPTLASMSYRGMSGFGGTALWEKDWEGGGWKDEDDSLTRRYL